MTARLTSMVLLAATVACNACDMHEYFLSDVSSEFWPGDTVHSPYIDNTLPTRACACSPTPYDRHRNKRYDLLARSHKLNRNYKRNSDTSRRPLHHVRGEQPCQATFSPKPQELNTHVADEGGLRHELEAKVAQAKVAALRAEQVWQAQRIKAA